MEQKRINLSADPHSKSFKKFECIYQRKKKKVMDVSEVRRKCLGDPFQLIHGGHCLYFFCYLCVKCSLNEGHYLTIYCWFSPKGGKTDIPKVWVSRQGNAIEINSNFLLCALDFSQELWMGFVGENKGKKEGRQQERREFRGRGFCPRNCVGRALSLFHSSFRDGQKLLWVMPLIPGPCLSPATSDFPLVYPMDGDIWEAGRAKITAICGRENSRRHPAGMKIGFYGNVPSVLINAHYGPRLNNLREAGICLQISKSWRIPVFHF